MADRYARPRRRRRSEEEYDDAARVAILALLEREHAVTIPEMEARLADRTYDPHVFPDPIDPHHLVNGRNALLDEGAVETTTAVTRSIDDSGAPHHVTTWSLPRTYGRKTIIDRTAERKRALMSRWLSWGRRRLLGDAGEDALAAALNESPILTRVTGSTRSVLGVVVAELDASAVYVPETTSGRLVAIQVVFEVKNKREHYYANDEDVVSFLTKAAIVQAADPEQLVLPIFVCRRRHYTLWPQGEREGFLPAMVRSQVVNKDPDLSTEEWATRFAEVRDEVFADLVALSAGYPTTNSHRGIVDTLIAERGLAYARLWREHHVDYLSPF